MAGAIIGAITYPFDEINKRVSPKVQKHTNLTEVFAAVHKEVAPTARTFTRRTMCNMAWTLGTRSYFFLVLNGLKHMHNPEPVY
jgi:hypothetical protein